MVDLTRRDRNSTLSRMLGFDNKEENTAYGTVYSPHARMQNVHHQRQHKPYVLAQRATRSTIMQP